MLENISAQPASHRALLTLQRGNHATLRACAELIRKAPGRVIFTGMGGSLFATLAAVSRMTQGDIRCRRWKAPSCCTTPAPL